MYQTTDFRKGLKIEYENNAYVIVNFQHVNPGKGSAFVRTKLKNLETGKVLDVTFKAGVDKVGIPDLQFRNMQYLYVSSQEYWFMDLTSYDQFFLSEEEVSEAKNYLVENSNVRVTFYKSKAVAINPTIMTIIIMHICLTILPDFGGGDCASFKDSVCSILINPLLALGDYLNRLFVLLVDSLVYIPMPSKCQDKPYARKPKIALSHNNDIFDIRPLATDI